ncbi:MAG: hypothetical protein QOD61_2237, partial [Solirubrobacteraceae bacterium]|nr:hypothetical protein [Solirubrobacteraceae bacterium]
DRLDALTGSDREAEAEAGLGHLRTLYELRLARLEARDHALGPAAGDAHGDRLASARRELLGAERRALEAMRAERRLASEVLAAVAHDLDLDEARLRR